jgi:hypothetical protein
MASHKARPSRLCLFWSRLLLRLVQFSSSLAAYVALQTACVTKKRSTRGRTVAVVVSNGAANFALVINFLAFVYALAFLVLIEWLRLCNRTRHRCEEVMDFVVLFALTVATLVLLLSDMTFHCRGHYGQFLHCGDLYLAIAMSFLSTLSFLAIVLLGFCTEDGDTQATDTEAQPSGSNTRGSATYVYHGSPQAEQR